MATTPCFLLPGSSQHNDVAFQDFTAGVASSGQAPKDAPSITAGIPRGPPGGAGTTWHPSLAARRIALGPLPLALATGGLPGDSGYQ
jgi:hypothetical protein